MSFSPVSSHSSISDTQIDSLVEKERSLLLKTREAKQNLEGSFHRCLDLLNSQALDLTIEDFDAMIEELEINRGENLQQFLNSLEEVLRETGGESQIRKTEEYRMIREKTEVTGEELYPAKFIVAASSLVHMKRVDNEVFPCSTRFDFYRLYEGSLDVLDSLAKLRHVVQDDDFSAFKDAIIEFDGKLSEVIERSYPLFSPEKVEHPFARALDREGKKEEKS